jgi:hypothetical protein
VGHCDGRCRLPVCDPNGGGNSDCSDHDAGWHGNRPALALLITLPAISLPSLIMLRKSFPAKALWLTGAGGVERGDCGEYCADVKKPGGASAYRAYSQVWVI